MLSERDAIGLALLVLLIAAAAKYGKHVQLGTQRRSGPRFFEAIQALKDGAIGKPYLARAWYANRS